ncbi:MAG: Mur ligase family protein [Coraliomargaritaceae bacterium]
MSFVEGAEKPLPRRVAVFGAGKSGSAAIRLCQHLGISCQLFDQDSKNTECYTTFGEGELSAFDAFVFSPGFAASHPWRILCQESDRPCFGECGFAASFWRGPLLGVTGTNGKTSVTTLLTDALNRSGLKAIAVGNVGRPLSEVCIENKDSESIWAVCELSSFQAELPRGLLLDGLIWTNFAEDHLDRYNSMEEYLQAKAKLLDCLKPGAPAVLGSSVPLESQPESRAGHWQTDLPINSIFSSPHQNENFQLIARIWRALELPEPALLSAASSFQTLPHRLQKVAQINGVDFWNDSKATNYHAALAAVASMESPIYWIGGGRSKGGDIRSFASDLSKGISAAYLYGEVGAKEAFHFSASMDRVSTYSSLEEAVKAASVDAIAAAPASVLLSPGFSSFDLFSSYEQRGECFTSTVLSLKQSSLVE